MSTQIIRGGCQYAAWSEDGTPFATHTRRFGYLQGVDMPHSSGATFEPVVGEGGVALFGAVSPAFSVTLFPTDDEFWGYADRAPCAALTAWAAKFGLVKDDTEGQTTYTGCKVAKIAGSCGIDTPGFTLSADVMCTGITPDQTYSAPTFTDAARTVADIFRWPKTRSTEFTLGSYSYYFQGMSFERNNNLTGLWAMGEQSEGTERLPIALVEGALETSLTLRTAKRINMGTILGTYTDDGVTNLTASVKLRNGSDDTWTFAFASQVSTDVKESIVKERGVTFYDYTFQAPPDTTAALTSTFA